VVPGLKPTSFTGTTEGKPGMAVMMIGYGHFQYHMKCARGPMYCAVNLGCGLRHVAYSGWWARLTDPVLASSRRGWRVLVPFDGAGIRLSYPKRIAKILTMHNALTKTISSTSRPRRRR
jgi:hypothetical protein